MNNLGSSPSALTDNELAQGVSAFTVSNEDQKSFPDENLEDEERMHMPSVVSFIPPKIVSKRNTQFPDNKTSFGQKSTRRKFSNAQTVELDGLQNPSKTGIANNKEEFLSIGSHMRMKNQYVVQVSQPSERKESSSPSHRSQHHGKLPVISYPSEVETQEQVVTQMAHSNQSKTSVTEITEEKDQFSETIESPRPDVNLFGYGNVSPAEFFKTHMLKNFDSLPWYRGKKDEAQTAQKGNTYDKLSNPHKYLTAAQAAKRQTQEADVLKPILEKIELQAKSRSPYWNSKRYSENNSSPNSHKKLNTKFINQQSGVSLEALPEAQKVSCLAVPSSSLFFQKTKFNDFLQGQIKAKTYRKSSNEVLKFGFTHTGAFSPSSTQKNLTPITPRTLENQQKVTNASLIVDATSSTRFIRHRNTSVQPQQAVKIEVASGFKPSIRLKNKHLEISNNDLTSVMTPISPQMSSLPESCNKFYFSIQDGSTQAFKTMNPSPKVSPVRQNITFQAKEPSLKDTMSSFQKSAVRMFSKTEYDSGFLLHRHKARSRSRPVFSLEKTPVDVSQIRSPVCFCAKDQTCPDHGDADLPTLITLLEEQIADLVVDEGFLNNDLDTIKRSADHVQASRKDNYKSQVIQAYAEKSQNLIVMQSQLDELTSRFDAVEDVELQRNLLGAQNQILQSELHEFKRKAFSKTISLDEALREAAIKISELEKTNFKSLAAKERKQKDVDDLLSELKATREVLLDVTRKSETHEAKVRSLQKENQLYLKIHNLNFKEDRQTQIAEKVTDKFKQFLKMYKANFIEEAMHEFTKQIEEKKLIEHQNHDTESVDSTEERLAMEQYRRFNEMKILADHNN